MLVYGVRITLHVWQLSNLIKAREAATEFDESWLDDIRETTEFEGRCALHIKYKVTELDAYPGR